MTLCLMRGTKPAGLEIKTCGFGENPVYLGVREIPMQDFLAAVCFVLVCSGLRKDDLRTQFVECVRSMKVTEGYLEITHGKKQDTKRLESDISPFVGGEKSGVDDGVVHMCGFEISLPDFLIAAHYVLTNSNLQAEDPRLRFVERVRSMRVADGRFTSSDDMASSGSPPAGVKLLTPHN